jgi:hypothetical protein
MGAPYIYDISHLRVKRLYWAGHIVRMSGDTTVFLEKPQEKKRKAGRSKLRWLDCTENGLKSMGVERPRKKSEDGLHGLSF